MDARVVVAARVAVALVTGCAHQGGTVPAWRERPGSVEGRGFYYADDRGLRVVTAGVVAEKPVARDVAVVVQALLDHVVVERAIEVHEDTGGQPTGHVHDVDAVTSASVTVLGGDRLEKARFEGTVGADVAREIGGFPARLQPSVRVSVERDYQSYSGRLGATTELFERHATVSAFVGFGHDRIVPDEVPPGESDLWPASHGRFNGGLSWSQVLSARLVLSGGVAANHQFGALSNPYRRALIRTSLFPERLPTSRTRVTLFTGLAWYLGRDTALHARAGGYADTWGVLAFVPEAAVVKQFGASVLATVQYRHYRQTAASFYRLRYEEIEEIRTGDARLGRIAEHQPGLEVSWHFVGDPGASGSMFVLTGYRLSLLHYRDLDRRVVAHIGSIAVGGAY